MEIHANYSRPYVGSGSRCIQLEINESPKYSWAEVGRFNLIGSIERRIRTFYKFISGVLTLLCLCVYFIITVAPIIYFQKYFIHGGTSIGMVVGLGGVFVMFFVYDYFYSLLYGYGGWWSDWRLWRNLSKRINRFLW